MIFAPNKIRTGVLRGGQSFEHDVSLQTGHAVLNNLPEQCEPLDIFISKEGIWHLQGAESNPAKVLHSMDLIVNALHGTFGEDGSVQRMLEDFGIPYTGSGQMASSFGMNKIKAKQAFRNAGLKTPHHIIIEDRGDGEATRAMVDEIFESLPFPIVIKPVSGGSSLGLSFADRKTGLKEAIKNSFKYSRPSATGGQAPSLIAEEYIAGKEVTCGVIEDFRDREMYALMPVEISTPNIFDYNSKYERSDTPRYRVPGNLTHEEKMMIEQAAEAAHRALGMRHYSRSDFIIHPRRGLFILETNSLPELSHRSAFTKSLEAAGSSLREFLSHLVSKVKGR